MTLCKCGSARGGAGMSTQRTAPLGGARAATATPGRSFPPEPTWTARGTVPQGPSGSSCRGLPRGASGDVCPKAFSVHTRVKMPVFYEPQKSLLIPPPRRSHPTSVTGDSQVECFLQGPPEVKGDESTLSRAFSRWRRPVGRSLRGCGGAVTGTPVKLPRC